MCSSGVIVSSRLPNSPDFHKYCIILQQFLNAISVAYSTLTQMCTTGKEEMRNVDRSNGRIGAQQRERWPKKRLVVNCM